jgi:hypothetical protein
MKECRVVTTGRMDGDSLQQTMDEQYKEGWELAECMNLSSSEKLFVFHRSTEEVFHVERLPIIQEADGPRFVGLHTQALVNDAMAVRRLAMFHGISGIKRIEGEHHPDDSKLWYKKPGWAVTIPFPKTGSTESRTFEAVTLGLACDNAKSYLEMTRKEKPVPSK